MRLFIYIFAFLFLASCTSRTIYKKPENVIPKSQMIDLWVDLYIANSTRAFKNEKLEKGLNYFPFIYQKYQIDSARFMQSNIYYTSRIEEYEDMFKKVEKKLLTLKFQLDPLSEGIDPSLPIYIRDSLRRINASKTSDSLVSQRKNTLKETKGLNDNKY